MLYTGGMAPQNGKTKAYDNEAHLRRSYPKDTPDPSAFNLPPRFTAKIQVDPDTGCWMWTAATGLAGYGRFGNNGGRKATPRVVLAHRFAFEQVIGRLPSRLALDHLCRRPLCCNPWHLEPVTLAENIRRGLQSNSDDLCRSGRHRLSETGTVEGGTRCGECRRESDRKRYGAAMPPPAERTHCPQDHPYSGDNLYVKPRTGSRECRQCHRERALKRYYAGKQQ